MAGSETSHQWLESMLINQPKFIGVDDRLIGRRELEKELYYRNTLFCCPDLYFIFKNGSRLLCEIKSGNNQKAYSKGMKQLEKIHLYYMLMGLEDPQTKLIMPAKEAKMFNIDTLYNLRVYRMGDEYRC